jgi:hypothetical protein
MAYTIYLDQSNLSKLALRKEDPRLAEKFQRLCNSGMLTPVFSMAHLHETWKYQNKDARKAIAAYADSFANSKWILSRYRLAAKEIEKAFFEFNGFPRDMINPLKEKLKHVLYDGMSEPIEIIVEDYGFTKTLDVVERDSGLQNNFEMWKRVDDSYPTTKALSSGAVKAIGAVGAMQKLRGYYRNYVDELLPDCLPNDEVPRPEQKKQFLDSDIWMQFDYCPSMHLMRCLDEEIIQDKDAPVSASQFVDLVHVSALPYVGLFLCDNRTRDYVKRVNLPPSVYSKCFSDLGIAIQNVV